SSEEISKQFYNIACSFNISAGSEETTVSISGLQENFDKAVELFEHLLHNCKADDEVLAGFKNRILKQRADNKLNKGQILNGLRSYATYGAQNPFNNQLSNQELEAVTAAELVDILHDLPNYKHTV